MASDCWSCVFVTDHPTSRFLDVSSTRMRRKSRVRHAHQHLLQPSEVASAVVAETVHEPRTYRATSAMLRSILSTPHQRHESCCGASTVMSSAMYTTFRSKLACYA
jgi:hypothetical protein